MKLHTIASSSPNASRWNDTHLIVRGFGKFGCIAPGPKPFRPERGYAGPHKPKLHGSLETYLHRLPWTLERYRRDAKSMPATNGAEGPVSEQTDVNSGPEVLDATKLLEAQEEAIPAEVAPLAECLRRAQAQQDEATGIREALEAEAQTVAELAVIARETSNKAQHKLDDASAELEAVKIVQKKVDTAVADLTRQIELDGLQRLRKRDNSPLQTMELGGREGDQDDDDEEVDLLPMLEAKKKELKEVAARLKETEEKVSAFRSRVSTARNAAAKAEEIASAAMYAAEAAVRDEMEAAAVVKESRAALNKALQEITYLESTATKDEDKMPKSKSDKSLQSLEFADDERKSDDKKLVGAKGSAAKAVDIKDDKMKLTRSMSFSEDVPPPNPMMEFATKHSWTVVCCVLMLAAVLFLQTTPGQAAKAKISGGVQVAVSAVRGVLCRIPLPEVPHGVEGIIETIWLLLTACIAVSVVCSLPGGSAVLGFLAGGAMVGPHALGIIKDVEQVRHVAELGVVFLLFNIGLELSLERLRSMQKFVFGMGSAQVVCTMAAVAFFAVSWMGMAGPAAIILGGGLALSSTAVAMQVLADRGETGSRHGRATFSVLLFQDLAVVVLLMLIPLLAPSETGTPGMGKIVKAISYAAVKAGVCISAIIVGGRVLLRPIYRSISGIGNQEIFAATTLLVVLGTSVITQLAGLSLALGAFLAGLLLAETEYHLQVESDIAPYKGLLMGLFFMTVGMEISVGLFFAKWKSVVSAIALLIIGKTAVMAGVGPLFGLSVPQAMRAGLLLAPGGEFAFVLLGEALAQRIMPNALVREVFLAVALSMALTPYLAEVGQKIGRAFEKSDMKALQPKGGEVDELRGHVILAGFGRVGQLIAQLLSERLIPFVALDVDAERVQMGKNLDLPVYFGDAGSPAVLASVGAHKASCAVITLDTPGANYRSVWALNKNFPHLKTFVRAHDVDHGLVLEKAGATAVVPEILEPSLQLAAAVLSELNMPEDEVANAIRSFRKHHLAELQLLAVKTGSSLGYGFATRDEDEEEESDEDDDDVQLAAVTARPLIEPVA